MGDWKVYGLFLATALYCQTLSIMDPFLPLISADKQVPEWMVGLMVATTPLASLLASPFVGSWLYRLGRRNTLCASFLLDVSSTQATGMAIAGSGLHLGVEGFFVLTVLGRVLSGSGNACLFTAVGTIIASDYPGQMTQYIGTNEACAGVGIMMGPLLGTGLYELFGYSGIFFGMACMFLVLCALFFIWQGADRPYHIESDESGFLSLLFQPRIAASLLPLAYAMCIIGALDVFLAPHLSTFDLSVGVIGALFGINGGVYVIASALLAYILGGFRIKTMNIVATILASAAILLVGPWPSYLPDSLILVLTGYIFLPVALSITFFEAIPCLLEVATKDLGMPNDDRLADLVAGW